MEKNDATIAAAQQWRGSLACLKLMLVLKRDVQTPQKLAQILVYEQLRNLYLWIKDSQQVELLIHLNIQLNKWITWLLLYQTMEILWMVTELLSQLELYMQVSILHIWFWGFKLKFLN